MALGAPVLLQLIYKGTHKKLFWGEIDLNNLPNYETWGQVIMNWFTQS